MILVVLLFALAQSASIQWTGQGGTNLWDNQRNWDCNCLPTPNDDVTIAFSLGPTSIRIGAVARARSLTIGGSQTQFFQTLTVSGSLLIGEGKLETNGILQVETAPTAPFNISGVFNINGRGFSFTSGLVGGNGTLRLLQGAAMNFTGPASKEFGGSLTLSLEGEATVFSSTGSSMFFKEQSSLKIAGALVAKTSLDVVVGEKAAFLTTGKGAFTFDPPASSAKVILQGPVVLDKWAVNQGTVTVLGKLNSGELTLGPTVNLQLVGGPDEKRVFQKINGGTILQQGGSSEFATGPHNILSLTVTGGNVAVTGTLQVDRLTVNGGSIAGPSSIMAKAATMTFAQFANGGGVTVINSLELNGQVTLDNAALLLLSSSQFRVSADSQLILQQRANIAVRGQVFQTSPLRLVKAALTGVPPVFLVERTASWQSSALLNSLGVSISGLGSFSLDKNARFDFSNADFAAGSFASTAGLFTFQQGNFSFQSVTGTGTFLGAPQTFTSTTFTASNFSMLDGKVNLTKSNVDYLLVNNGQLSVSDATLGVFDFKGGVLSGLGVVASNNTASVRNLVVTGIPAKTLQSCVVTVTGLSLSCGPTQCAFFTRDATLQTK